MQETPRIGLVAPLPPQVGGVAAFAQWLRDSEAEIGVRYDTFDLHRPPGDEVGGRLRLRSIPRQLTQLGRFLRWLRRAPQIVHYCVSLTPTGLPRDLLFVALLRALGRRPVTHLHGPAGEPNRFGLLRRAALRALAALSVCRVAVVVLDGWSFVPNPLRVVPPPVAPRRDSRSLRVLSVGAFGRAKGSDLLLRAVAQLRAEETPLTLRIVGGELRRGDERALRRQVAELGLDGYVEFAGVLESEAVAAEYRDADVFCLPSLREGLPMALLEAMAYALPVVTTPVGAIPAVVEPERSGLLVEPANEVELVAALRRLARDHDLRLRLGRSAADRVRAMCDPHRIARTWSRLYTDAG